MLAALTSAEYKASIFRQSGQTPPPPMCIGSALKEGADVQHGGAGAALTGGGAGADVLRTPVLRDTTSPSKRKVWFSCSLDLTVRMPFQHIIGSY